MDKGLVLTAQLAGLANKFAQKGGARFVTKLHEILVPVFCPYA